jgi:DNA-binding response OmpR family regulator
LIVEDDLVAIFALRHFFAVAGYDVDCAAGPIEALRLLDQNPYHAVITDLHLLPGRHSEGMRIAAHARTRNPRACVVMLTANGSDLTEAEALRSGVDVFRTKPIELGQLAACVCRVMTDHGGPSAAPVPAPWSAQEHGA